jgi:hypothetical protein
MKSKIGGIYISKIPKNESSWRLEIGLIKNNINSTISMVCESYEEVIETLKKYNL